MMSKLTRGFTILLTIIALILIGWSITDFDTNKINYIEPSNRELTYQSQNMVTLAYEPTGRLGYKLVSDEVKHYAAQKETWFSLPIMTMYDNQGTAIWLVRANKAKLDSTKILSLFGDVEVNNLAADSQLEKMVTDNANIDLTTQDITTDDRVTLLGLNFSSTGIKMRGNLRNKTAELLEQVITNYLPVTD